MTDGRAEVWEQAFRRTSPLETRRVLEIARQRGEEEAGLAGLIRATLPPELAADDEPAG